MVPDTLSQHADLVTRVTVNSDLIPWIRSSQEAATGDLGLQSKSFSDHEERGFCVWDGLACHAHPKGGYTIFIPEDEEFHYKLLYLHHNLPLVGNLGVFWVVKALSSRYYWQGI